MCLSVTSQLNILYTVNFLSKFNSNHNIFKKAAEKILRYLMKSFCLLYRKTNCYLYGVVDADLVASMTDRLIIFQSLLVMQPLVGKQETEY